MLGERQWFSPISLLAMKTSFRSSCPRCTLLGAEDQKGESLTYDEVIRIRDEAPCIMMRADHLQRLAESRGHNDF